MENEPVLVPKEKTIKISKKIMVVTLLILFNFIYIKHTLALSPCIPAPQAGIVCPYPEILLQSQDQTDTINYIKQKISEANGSIEYSSKESDKYNIRYEVPKYNFEKFIITIKNIEKETNSAKINDLVEITDLNNYVIQGESNVSGWIVIQQTSYFNLKNKNFIIFGVIILILLYFLIFRKKNF